MGRPKQSKTRGRKRKTADKGDEPEMRKGELSLGAPIEIDSKTFEFHMRAIKSATERKDTANNLLRGCYKSAKQVNEHLGDAIKKMITLERANDPAKFKSELEVLGIALKETGSPIQLSVHDTLLGDVNDQAYARGEKAGAAGMPMANPYPVSSDLASQYAEGWRRGQEKLLSLPLEGDGSGIGHNSAAQAAE